MKNPRQGQAAERARRIGELDAELRSLSGKLKSREPELLAGVEKTHAELTEKLGKLEQSVMQLIVECLKPRQEDVALQQAEVLRLATLDYCRQTRIDPELWKNIAF